MSVSGVTNDYVLLPAPHYIVTINIDICTLQTISNNQKLNEIKMLRFKLTCCKVGPDKEGSKEISFLISADTACKDVCNLDNMQKLLQASSDASGVMGGVNVFVRT